MAESRTISNVQIHDSIAVKTEIGDLTGEVVAITPSGTRLNVTLSTTRGDIVLNFLPGDTVTIVPPAKALFAAMHFCNGRTRAHLFVSDAKQAEIDHLKLGRLLGCDMDQDKDARLSWGPVATTLSIPPEEMLDTEGKTLPVYG